MFFFLEVCILLLVCEYMTSPALQPTLDRQTVRTEEEDVPEVGEGSEYGRKWKEEARKKKRGYAIKKANPDDQPGVLREHKKGGKQ